MWGHTELGGSDPVTGVLNAEKFEHRQMQGEHHVTAEAEIGAMCVQAKDCQWLLAATQSEGEARKDPFLEPSEGAWLCWHPDFRLIASRILREYISVSLNYLVCGHLLWQP